MVTPAYQGMGLGNSASSGAAGLQVLPEHSTDSNTYACTASERTRQSGSLQPTIQQRLVRVRTELGLRTGVGKLTRFIQNIKTSRVELNAPEQLQKSESFSGRVRNSEHVIQLAFGRIRRWTPPTSDHWSGRVTQAARPVQIINRDPTAAR